MYLVWGLGKSGSAAVKLLISKRLNFLAGDDSNDPNLWREVIDSVDCVVLSPGIPPSHPLWIEARRREIEVIGELELAFRFHRGKTVAITGTDGKSTTTELVYRMLKESLSTDVFKAGNIGIPFSEVVMDNPEGVVVLEISSFQGKTLRSFRADAGIFLNFSVDHLDWHPSLEDYLRSKYKVFMNQREEDLLILSSHQEELVNTPSRAKRVKLWEGLRLYKDRVIYGDIVLRLDSIKLAGKHNLINLMSASLLATRMGASQREIEKVAYSFRGLPYRLEFIGELGGVRVYNDSKSTTSNSLAAALESFEGKRVLLIAGGKDKGDNFSSVAHLVGQRVRYALLIGESSKKMARAWEGKTECFLMASLEEAVYRAFELAEEGDILLFSPGCSSFDMFRDYKDRAQRFNSLIRDLKSSQGW
jgi:UDP-N-acetylmuramoylalanine--D-glutamate ligase